MSVSDNSQHFTIEYPRGRNGFEWPSPSIARRAGAFLYGTVSKEIRRRRMGQRRARWDDTPIISIGNLEVGGSGKTPFAILLLEHLTRSGRRPVYVSRGFGGLAEKLPATSIVAPASARLTASTPDATRWIRPPAAGMAGSIGDEGAMVAMHFFKGQHEVERAMQLLRTIGWVSALVLSRLSKKFSREQLTGCGGFGRFLHSGKLALLPCYDLCLVFKSTSSFLALAGTFLADHTAGT